jgi:16S rRNA (guanine(966)-N(2))-methyltransferase RsmD
LSRTRTGVSTFVLERDMCDVDEAVNPPKELTVRIVAGTAKGRTLRTPRSADVIRPTADRVRQTLFDVLGQSCEGLRVLDLFAGTGALSLEALSRGASQAVLVDAGKEAQALCRSNAKALGFELQVEVIALTVVAALEVLATRKACFDLVFSDPPYALRAGSEVVARVTEGGLLGPGGRVVVEHSRAEAVTAALPLLDRRAFGDTVVSIFG